MIPKIIHYVWIGKKNKDANVIECIESWKKFAPDYEIIEWNEDNFDVNSNDYVRQAIESGKFAFASDYIRAFVVYNFGGIYLDTDCQIKKNIDIFLQEKAFACFETKKVISTAVFGAESKHPFVKDMLDYYNNKKFIKDNGEKVNVPNTVYVTRLLSDKYSAKMNNKKQNLRNGLTLYPSIYFTLDNNGDNNYITHHFSGSWLEKNSNYKKFVNQIMGSKIKWHIVYKWKYYLMFFIKICKKQFSRYFQ